VNLKKAARIRLPPPSVPFPPALTFSRLPIYAYYLFLSFAYVCVLSVPRAPDNISPIANGSSGVALFDTTKLKVNLTKAVPILGHSAAFVALTELMNCEDFLSCVIMPVLVLADRLVVCSVSENVKLYWAAVLVLVAFRVMLLKAWGWSAIVSLLLMVVAAARRREFVVFFIPLLVVSVCERKKYLETVLEFALGLVIVMIGWKKWVSVQDEPTGSPVGRWALIKADRNGLCGAAVITAVMALWRRVDTSLAVGLALAVIVTVLSPFESWQDHERSRVIAVRLIAYVWVAIGTKRNSWWITTGVMLVRVIVAYIFAWVYKGTPGT
jgi:hypothetical protein